MARAICDKCGGEFYWYGGKGLRLSDRKSPCCGAPASGKKGNPIRSPRLDMPKVRALTENAQYSTQAAAAARSVYWYSPKRRTIFLRPDGLVNVSRSHLTFTVDPEPTIEGEFTYRILRHFEAFLHRLGPVLSDPGGYTMAIRIYEADYQKLLARQVNNG